MIGEGAGHPDKALFTPSRIYLEGEDKGNWVGKQRVDMQSLNGKVQAKCHHHTTQSEPVQGEKKVFSVLYFRQKAIPGTEARPVKGLYCAF